MQELKEIREFFEIGLKGVKAIPEERLKGKTGEAVSMLTRMLKNCDLVAAALQDVQKNWQETWQDEA